MVHKSGKLSRRKFIGTTGTAFAALTIVPSRVLAGRGYPQPSDLPNIACIGISNQGCSDLKQIATPDVPIQPLTAAQLSFLPKPAQEYARLVLEWEKPAPGQPEPKPIRHANIYALCDVDSNYAAPVFAGYPKAKRYEDWRIMLEKEKSLDGVVIATPDHNHAPIAAAFIRDKKHIYLQKPLAKTIYECRKLARFG